MASSAGPVVKSSYDLTIGLFPKQASLHRIVLYLRPMGNEGGGIHVVDVLSPVLPRLQCMWWPYY